MVMREWLSEIDTRRFGFNVAKIPEWPEDPETILHQLKADHVKLIITRLPAEDIETINKLEVLGFQLKDTQLTYKYDLKALNFGSLVLSTSLKVREAMAVDLPALGRLARQSFSHYGHYANNSRLDKSRVDEIYEDWAISSFNNPDYADKFFLVAASEQIAGFLTFKLVHQGGKHFAKGGIGAVSEAFRNQGIFKILNKQGLLWGKSLNLDWIEHNALTTNYSVGKVFTSLGFYNAASYVTLHCWLD
jgi:hypothetical protein